jgi:hypothetical protein
VTEIIDALRAKARELHTAADALEAAASTLARLQPQPAPAISLFDGQTQPHGDPDDVRVKP